MNSTNGNNNLKRKKIENYPEMDLGPNKKKGGVSSAMNFKPINTKISKILNTKVDRNEPSVSAGNSLSKFQSTHTNKSVSLNKARMNNFNHQNHHLSNLSTNNVNQKSIPNRSTSEVPNQRDKISADSKQKILNSLPSVNKNELLTDYWQCGGDINNLRETLKNKKRNSTNNNEETKKKIEQLTSFIQNTNSYINNVCKNYTEKFRRSVDTNISQFTGKFSEIAEFAEITEKPANNFTSHSTEPKHKNDSNSKRRFSLPNFSYSNDLNPFCSTDITQNPNTSSNESAKNDDRMHIEDVNQFSFHLDDGKEKEEYYKSKIKTEDSELANINLDKEQCQEIEIITSKIKEKEKEFNFEIQNFDLLIKTQSDSTEDKQKIVQEYMEREISLIQSLEKTKQALMRKASENLSLSQSIKELMNELNRGESHRRRLHNYIQELRGNIRVYCRVKPCGEDVNMNLDQSMCDMNQVRSIVRYPELGLGSGKDLYTIEILNKESSSNNNNSSIFHFDRIFPENSTQKEIFSEIKPFIQSALDGENVCIFAYGATGSGKTYTMQGPSWALAENQLIISEFSGILPRTAEYIFEELSRMNKMSLTFKIFISAIEIYNENIYDLFDPNPNKQSLQIFQNKNTVQIKNMLWNQIKSKEDIIKYCKEASESRRSDSTQYNENSSRSHAIYQIKIESTKGGSNVESFINIIDLAGSEKCTISTFKEKSKEEIESMKKLQNEANFINKSLSTLGRIISLLADKKSSKLSIPYRESKLTMILQNSLKATSKTAMIVTICSDISTLQQGKDSLKFATNAMMAC